MGYARLNSKGTQMQEKQQKERIFAPRATTHFIQNIFFLFSKLEQFEEFSRFSSRLSSYSSFLLQQEDYLSSSVLALYHALSQFILVKKINFVILFKTTQVFGSKQAEEATDSAFKLGRSEFFSAGISCPTALNGWNDRKERRLSTSGAFDLNLAELE